MLDLLLSSVNFLFNLNCIVLLWLMYRWFVRIKLILWYTGCVCVTHDMQPWHTNYDLNQYTGALYFTFNSQIRAAICIIRQGCFMYNWACNIVNKLMMLMKAVLSIRTPDSLLFKVSAHYFTFGCTAEKTKTLVILLISLAKAIVIFIWSRLYCIIFSNKNTSRLTISSRYQNTITTIRMYIQPQMRSKYCIHSFLSINCTVHILPDFCIYSVMVQN